MIPAYTLPTSRRRDFAVPRGPIVSGDFTEILDLSAPTITCVGDIVSQYCSKLHHKYNGLLVLIVDGKTRRHVDTREPSRMLSYDVKIKVHNPRGTISFNSYLNLCQLLRSEETRQTYLIEVIGEEDMLALPSIACTPPGGYVIYGVPLKGAAIIRSTRITLWDSNNRLLELLPQTAPRRHK